jgi:hypothetical protein
MSDAVHTGELMPARAAARGELTTDNLADAIGQLYAQWQVVHRANNILMLRMGILMEWAKELTPQGDWESWFDAHITMSRAHAYRFRAVAQRFMEQHCIGPSAAFLIGTAAEDEAPEELQQFEQLALDFIGDKTQAELFEQCGAVRYRTGGDHGGGKARAEKYPSAHHFRMAMAMRDWTEIQRRLREFVLMRKDYALLDPGVVREGIQSLRDCVAQMRTLGGLEKGD